MFGLRKLECCGHFMAKTFDLLDLSSFNIVILQCNGRTDGRMTGRIIPYHLPRLHGCNALLDSLFAFC